MGKAIIADSRELRGRERMIDKARRLLDEDRVSERNDGTFRVLGDTTIHTLAFSRPGAEEPTLHCSCKAGSFGNGCSHRFAVELHLSQKRRAA